MMILGSLSPPAITAVYVMIKLCSFLGEKTPLFLRLLFIRRFVVVVDDRSAAGVVLSVAAAFALD